MLIDKFDRTNCDKKIIFASDICVSKIKGHIESSCAVGTLIVAKGDKQSWICQVKLGTGIVGNETIQSKGDGNIGNHIYYETGYGIALSKEGDMVKSHNEDNEGDGWVTPAYGLDYGEQFKKEDGFLMTITLDMTQQKGDHGILTYEFHMEPQDHINKIRTDGVYTNVAWDDIDIETKYRIAFSIESKCSDNTVQFLEAMP